MGFSALLLGLLLGGAAAAVHQPSSGELALRSVFASTAQAIKSSSLKNPRALLVETLPLLQAQAAAAFQPPSDWRRAAPAAGDDYYAFIPIVVNVSFTPAGQTSAAWSAPCFAVNNASYTVNANGSVVFTLHASQPSSSNCSDFYMIATVDGLNTQLVSAAGSFDIMLPNPNSRPGSSTWLANTGPRLFRFPMSDPWAVLASIVDTISLFVPALTEPILDAASAARNRDFLANHVNINFAPRSAGLVNLDESYFGSGDCLAIHRMDGLSTLESWGTGAHTSHIAMFLRMGPAQDLYIVESTDTTSDWPVPNIQRTLWKNWVPMALASNYSIVHLPLATLVARRFNQSAAEAYVMATLGLPYGYRGFISTFFDTETQNLPFPASWQFFEVIFGLLDTLSSDLVNLLVTSNFNMKLGKGAPTNFSFVGAVNAFRALGVNVGQAMAMPEQDTYIFSDGPSMVCDVYFCAIHKAAGTFGALANQIQCTEFENRGVYALNIYNSTRTRPAACVAADPGMPFCQLMGAWQLELPMANTIAPYAGMNEHCPSLPPLYTRPDGC